MKRFHSALQLHRVCSRAFILATIGCVALTGSPYSSPAATLVVTNLADNGPGTLRSALTNAQNGDVITFAVTGNIVNSSPQDGMIISNNVAIVGPGANMLAVRGLYRAFYINSGVTVSISGLTFANCVGIDGGGIYNNGGNLSISSCVFTNCKVANLIGGTGLNGYGGFSGGAILNNAGTLAAVNCLFLHNSAGNGNSGLPGNWFGYLLNGGHGGGGGSGGAVYDAGSACFTNCTFGWNSTGYGGDGGNGPSGAPGNGLLGGGAGDGGNGSAVFSTGGVTFVSCTFFGNTNGAGGKAGNGGDGYYVNNRGGNGGNGGNAGSGALYCTGSAKLIACTFANNTAGQGGNGGSGGHGANNANGGPGGKGGNGGNSGNGGSGGGILGPSTNSAFSLQNVLIAQNLAASAGLAGSGGTGGSGTSSGANGSAGFSGTAGTGPDLCGSFISQGHNLVGLRTGNSGFTNNVLGDIVGTNTTVNAKLGTLTNNSGRVWTCALQNGSPALDAGDDTIIGSPLNLTNDSRGYPRKSGSHVDIGAYENQWATAPVTFKSAITGGGVQLMITNAPGAYFTVLGAGSLTTPLASWTVLGVMSEISPGQFQWTDASYTNRSLRFFRLRNP